MKNWQIAAQQAIDAMKSGIWEAQLKAIKGLEIALEVQPVKQDPVAWAYIDADGSFMDALDRQHGAYQTPLYDAPVDAKAIRAEALEEAAKIADGFDNTDGFRVSAAIRRLK